MTMISPEVGARRCPGFSLAIRARRWIAKAAERRRVRREIADLSNLPDHLIRDIGLEGHMPPRHPAMPDLSGVYPMHAAPRWPATADAPQL